MVIDQEWKQKSGKMNKNVLFAYCCEVDCKEIRTVHSKGEQSWVFIGRTDAKAEAPILWPPHAKRKLTGKDPDAGKD